MQKVVSSKVVINGQTYECLEDVPVEIREQYGTYFEQVFGDANGNGIPDLLEKGPLTGANPSLDDIKSMLDGGQLLALGLGLKRLNGSTNASSVQGLFKSPAASGGPTPGGSSIGSTIRNMIVVAALLLLIYFIGTYGG